MSIYISSPVVDLRDKFILSFDVNMSKHNEIIGIGVDSVKRRSTTVTNLDTFITKINKVLVIDNGFTLVNYSSKYTTNGTYTWRKDNTNTDILGLELRIVNNKIFEEVKDISSYNPDVDVSIYVDGKKLFKHIPDKYINDNGVIKLVNSKSPITSIFSFESGKLKLEDYITQETLHNFSDKLRFIISNNSTTFGVSKRIEEVYNNIESFFFSSAVQSGYIYLLNENITCNNLNITYK